MFPFNWPVPPFFNLGVDLLVEVRYRAGTDPRAPQRFGDVLHPADRNTRQIHLHQGFLNTAFPALIALNDGRLKCLTAQLRHLQLHCASLGVQR